MNQQEQELLGVSFDVKRGLYKARIFFEGHERYMGRFPTSEEAALAYDQAARFINSISEASGFNDASSRKRPRPLNFPNRCLNDPKVAQKLQRLLAKLQAGSAAAAAATAGYFSADMYMLAATATPGSCSELQVPFWGPPSQLTLNNQAGEQFATQHLQYQFESADPAELLAALDAAAAVTLSAGGGAVGTELSRPTASSAQQEAAIAEGLGANTSSSSLPGALQLAASRKRTASTMEQQQQHLESWQQQQMLHAPSGRVSTPQGSPLTTLLLPAAAVNVPCANGSASLLPQPQSQQQQWQSSLLLQSAGLLDACSMPLTSVDTLDDSEWSDLLAAVGVQSSAPEFTAGDPAIVQLHDQQHAGTGQSLRLADSMQPVSPSEAGAPHVAGNNAGDGQYLSAGSATSHNSIAGSSNPSKQACSRRQPQQQTAAHAAVAVDVGSGTYSFPSLPPPPPPPAAAAAPAPAPAARGEHGVLPCLQSRFQALAMLDMLLHCLDDLGTHLLAQDQHQPQPNSSGSSSSGNGGGDGVYLQAMSEWLQLAWHMEVISGGGLPAAVAPGAVSAAITAARATPADAVAPNRLALQSLDRLLLVLRDGQHASSAHHSVVTATARRGALDNVVLTVLLQLQQGLTEVQQAVCAAAPGVGVDVRQLLQARLDIRAPGHITSAALAVLRCFVGLL